MTMTPRSGDVRRFRITVEGKVYDVTVEEVPPASLSPASPGARTASGPAASGSDGFPEAHSAVEAGPPASEDGTVAAPMSGSVVAVRVTPGQKVARGDVLVVLSAMKMENEIQADSDGTVAELFVAENDAVQAGDPLLRLEA